MSFTPRTTAPATTDKYWIHTSKGGLNSCILIKGNSCIPNCVGYAWGRAYEILGTRPKLSKSNAEDWYGYKADGYKRGSVPKVGAIACWSKGKVGVASDGAGHVAPVEEVKADGSIVVSESGYNAYRFRTRTIKAPYLIAGYKFQGFIYLLDEKSPTIPPETPKTPSGVKVEAAKKKDIKLSGTYTTTATLHLRTGAGTTKKSICLMPKGVKVENYGYYTEVNGVKWLYVSYFGEVGFCSSNWLKK